MHYQRLGRIGMKVSQVILGSWLTFGNSVDQETTNACVKASFDAGINTIDTADVYSLGKSERALGEALQNYPRKSYVLASKVFWPTGDGVNERGLSRKHIVESVDESLERLKTKYLDLYQCHRYDDEADLRETVYAMEDLVRAGKTLYWGVSVWTGEQMRAATTIAREYGGYGPVSNQPQYNMLTREIELDALPAARELEMGTIVWSPMAQGMLTGKYRSKDHVPAGTRRADSGANRFLVEYMSEENFRLVEELRGVAKEMDCSMAQLALAWCLKREGVTSVIVGVTKPEQIRENAAAADIVIPDGLWRRLEKLIPAAE